MHCRLIGSDRLGGGEGRLNAGAVDGRALFEGRDVLQDHFDEVLIADF